MITRYVLIPFFSGLWVERSGVADMITRYVLIPFFSGLWVELARSVGLVKLTGLNPLLFGSLGRTGKLAGVL